MASVSKVVNLSGALWGHVTFTGVLPQPHAGDDGLKGLALVGVMRVVLTILVLLFTRISQF